MVLLRKLTGEQKQTVAHWAMEVVVVIAGVLIALWVQQWADRRRALQDMAAAEEAIHDEVKAALFALIWREAISRCHFDRAELLRDMLLKAGNRWPGLNENAISQSSIHDVTGVTTAVPSVYQRPGDSYTTAAWTSALATGALAPMDRDRFGKLVRLYDQIRELAEAGAVEDAAAATLSALAFPQEITPDTRARMLQALYEIDRARFMYAVSARSEFVNGMRELGWNDRAAVDRFIREEKASIRQMGIRFRPCVSAHRNPFTPDP